MRQFSCELWTKSGSEPKLVVGSCIWGLGLGLGLVLVLGVGLGLAFWFRLGLGFGLGLVPDSIRIYCV